MGVIKIDTFYQILNDHMITFHVFSYWIITLFWGLLVLFAESDDIILMY